jgi:hypothetical protein
LLLLAPPFPLLLCGSCALPAPLSAGAGLALGPLVVATAALTVAAVLAVVAPPLPQSDCAAADTVSPCVGPGGVSWATPDTYSPWLVTSAGHGGAVTALRVGCVPWSPALAVVGSVLASGAADVDVDAAVELVVEVAVVVGVVVVEAVVVLVVVVATMARGANGSSDGTTVTLSDE